MSPIRSRLPIRSAVPLLVALVLLACPACGGDDDASSSGDRPAGPSDSRAEPTLVGSRSHLTVVAHDIRFDAETYEVDAGEVAITYDNEGNLPHSLVIEGVGGLEMRAKAHGDDEATVELEPGEYTIYCDVPGHRSAGMEATLEVS